MNRIKQESCIETYFYLFLKYFIDLEINWRNNIT